ncbi:MAG: hypothetical protein PHW27_12570 [Melioribacteraceae bacterium]|nr:hypothetical protein [Melioribacteraceae bacterium]MDD3559393.1 hypothetical protein [Melioribacteraceae bacterium]
MSLIKKIFLPNTKKLDEKRDINSLAGLLDYINSYDSTENQCGNEALLALIRLNDKSAIDAITNFLYQLTDKNKNYETARFIGQKLLQSELPENKRSLIEGIIYPRSTYETVDVLVIKLDPKVTRDEETQAELDKYYKDRNKQIEKQMDYKEKYNIKLSHQLYVCGKPYDPYQSACNERDRTLEKLANLKSKIAVPYLIDFLRNKFYKRTNLLVEEKQYLLALDALEKIGVPSLKPMEELYDEMNNFIYQLRIKGIFGTYDEVHLAGLLKKTIDRISPPQILPPEKIIVGYCNNCGRELKIKKENVKPVMNLTCKCGFHNKIETE